MKQDEAAQPKALGVLILLLSVAILAYLASYAFAFWESPDRLVLIFIPAILILWSLHKIGDRAFLPSLGRWKLMLGVLVIIILAYSGYYFFTEFWELLYQRAGNNNLADIVLGGLLLLIVLLAAWKEMGLTILIIFFVFVGYAFWGKYLPYGTLLHTAGISFSAFMRFAVLMPDGIFGLFAKSGFTLVTIFLFFAGVVGGFGGLAYIINLSRRLTRGFAWGLAQIPVIASMIFGSFSGAAAANVAGTGAFTIPMMKRFGITPKTAAAIEAVASTGGQIMPPVMGVAAFLMAELLDIPYIKIVAMGFAPAILFYASVAFGVYLITRDMIINLPRFQQQDELREDFHVIDGLPLVVAILVLLFYLVYFGSSVIVSGIWMLASYLVVQLIISLWRGGLSLSMLGNFFQKAAYGIREGGDSAAGIMVLLCTMGVVAKMLIVSGLSQDLSYWMVDLSAGRLLFLLPLVFIVCILMGMAVSTVVVYIVVVLLAAPALISYGIAPHVAHFAVFYMALIAALTPPIAVPVAIASGIAKSPFMSTGWLSMRIGMPLFVLPFVFLFKPEILAADLVATPLAFLQILVGLLAVTYGLHGKPPGIIGYCIRFLFFAIGAVAIFSTTDLIVWPSVIAIGILTILVFMMKKRRENPTLAN